MSVKPLLIYVEWDHEAMVCLATSEDVPGLAPEEMTWQKEELDHRYAEYQAGKQSSKQWDSVHKELRRKYECGWFIRSGQYRIWNARCDGMKSKSQAKKLLSIPLIPQSMPRIRF